MTTQQLMSMLELKLEPGNLPSDGSYRHRYYHWHLLYGYIFFREEDEEHALELLRWACTQYYSDAHESLVMGMSFWPARLMAPLVNHFLVSAHKVTDNLGSVILGRTLQYYGWRYWPSVCYDSIDANFLGAENTHLGSRGLANRSALHRSPRLGGRR